MQKNKKRQESCAVQTEDISHYVFKINRQRKGVIMYVPFISDLYFIKSVEK